MWRQVVRVESDGGRTGADPEADPPAPPCGSLQWGRLWELTPYGIKPYGVTYYQMYTSVYRYTCYYLPPAFCPDMNSVEWLERLEDFFYVSRVPLSDHGVVAHYLLSDSVRQTIKQYAQEVAEIGRSAGVSERDPVARFAGGITSKKAHLAIRLQEPQTLAEAQKLVSKVMRGEEDFHQSRQLHTGNPKLEKTEVAQSINALIREVGKLSLKLERQEPTAVRPARREDGYRKLSDCITRGLPLRDINLRSAFKKQLAVCSLTISKCTALVTIHVKTEIYVLLVLGLRARVSERVYNGPAKSTAVWLNGADSSTRSTG
ncbi:hypothetical protein T02_8512 [Trichinella nativa]|uniref:Uncharacterized protein n=1 Tax=Trichinella nativa TaxID=6335 RepID=A0A0V1LPI0_9BILA|nr:hypothetical protein T02_8512 [Trichinella nativa]